jgi:amino acid adenylation domain-containing protein
LWSIPLKEVNFGIKPPPDFSPISDQILEGTLLSQFERIVEKYPNRSALKDSSKSLSYLELNNAANNLARTITDVIGEDKSPVAFLFNREFCSIIAVMAIMKSGKPSLGLHPDNSKEQILAFLEHSTAKLLITTSDLKEIAGYLTEAIPDIKVITYDEIQKQVIHEKPVYTTGPNDPFGIFYTSGSTGEPKGVVVGHLYKSQSIQYQTNGWRFSPSDRISLVTSVCYLASHPSLFGALLNGGLLCLFDLKKNSAQQALDWIINENLTVFRSTPSIFRSIFSLAPEELCFSNLRLITLGGEPVPGSDIELFKKHTDENCVLVNNFAATETGSISHYVVRHDHPPLPGFLPAGLAAPGKEVFLLDDDDQQVDRGKSGEIVVRSKYLNLGYWRREELTAKKYRQDPSNSAYKYYATGDLGRIREDGFLEVAGRKDTQVKVRGYRMQLEAIDLALQKLPSVRDAATIVHKDATSVERLVAYLSMEDNRDIPVTQFRQILTKHLPEFMVPSIYVKMEALPRSVTGKLSRLDLPEPSWERPNLDTAYVAPQSELEIQIALVWKQLLSVDSVGVDDNFFELGGDSLLALQMSLEVEELTLSTFPQSFFKNPTIRTLQSLIKVFDQAKVEDQAFNVISYPKEGQIPTASISTESRLPLIKRLVNRRYSTRDIEHLYRNIDQFVGKTIANRSFDDAITWMVRWSRNPFVQKVIYRHRKALFRQWLCDLSDISSEVQGNFELNLLTNMFFRMPRSVLGRDKNATVEISHYKSSPYLFWRSLGEKIENSTIQQLEEGFPISGLDYLAEAYQKGKGVILVSYHGTPHPGGFLPLSKVLGLDWIPTISYQIAIRRSKYQANREEISGTAAATLNAEIALFGQKKLQEGKIVSYFSDTNDTRGRTYNVSMGGRAYQMKAGLAEMALNTGAAIIPFSRYCLPDGRIQMEFLPELQAGDGNRQDQVTKIIQDYAAFIEQSWRRHPEGASWIKMRRHLERSSSKAAN